jgi:hypothetical protein
MGSPYFSDPAGKIKRDKERVVNPLPALFYLEMPFMHMPQMPRQSELTSQRLVVVTGGLMRCVDGVCNQFLPAF